METYNKQAPTQADKTAQTRRQTSVERVKQACSFGVRSRHAKSAFQTRREREIRLETALVKAQVMAEGYDTGEAEATY